VAGRNRPTDSLRRLRDADYRARLARLGVRGVLAGLRGSLLGSGRMLDAPARVAVLRRILDEGHELAVHGFDHAWWADHVWDTPADALCAEIERARGAVREAIGVDVRVWGSPSWRTTDDVLRHLAATGAPYLADCWGSGPFVTVASDGRTIDLPHLPVTLPSLEALALSDGLDADAAVERVLARHTAGRADVICMHDYFEGLLRPAWFDTFLAGCARRGLATVTLAGLADTLAKCEDRLPRRPLCRGPLAGFSGEVSWQDDRPTASRPTPATVVRDAVH